jgi:hypothetical protein
MASKMSPNPLNNTSSCPLPCQPAQTEDHALHAPLSPPPTVRKALTPKLKDQDYHDTPHRWGLIPLRTTQAKGRTSIHLFFLFAVLLGLLCWWKRGSHHDLENWRQRANELKRNLLLPVALSGHHFVPASNQNIHVSPEKRCNHSQLTTSVCWTLDLYDQSPSKG